MSTIRKLRIQVSKTADGEHDYLQILSGDQFTVNVVLIADSIEITDARAVKPKPRQTGRKSA